MRTFYIDIYRYISHISYARSRRSSHLIFVDVLPVAYVFLVISYLISDGVEQVTIESDNAAAIVISKFLSYQQTGAIFTLYIPHIPYMASYR